MTSVKIIKWNTLEIDRPVLEFICDAIYTNSNKWGRITYKMTRKLFIQERFFADDYEWIKSQEALDKKSNVNECFSPFSSSSKLID